MNPSEYPAAIGYLLNTAVAIVIAFDVLPAGVAHGIATAGVALASLVVLFFVRPLAVAAITAAAQTFLVSLAAFGFHLSDEKLAAVMGAVTLILGVITHYIGTPAGAYNRGTTQQAIEQQARGRAKSYA